MEPTVPDLHLDSKLQNNRVETLAARMLAGSSKASISCYRYGLEIIALAHQLIDSNTLLLAFRSADLAELEFFAQLAGGESRHEVRLNLELANYLSHAAITVASAHALGELSILSAANPPRQLPKPFQELQANSLTEITIAELKIAKVLVHDFTGVTPIETSQNLHLNPCLLDEFTRFEAMRLIDEETVRHLIQLVFNRKIQGQTHISPAPFLKKSAVKDFATVLDLDISGITLLKTTGKEIFTAYIPFKSEGHCLAAIQSHLNQLAAL